MREAVVTAAAVLGGVPGNVVIRRPFALEILRSGTPRVLRSWARRERNEGELGGIGAVTDLGGEALLDVVWVGGGGGGEGALGCRRRRRERVLGVGGKGKTGERLGLPVKGMSMLV